MTSIRLQDKFVLMTVQYVLELEKLKLLGGGAKPQHSGSGG
jgi:hypothetical protein